MKPTEYRNMTDKELNEKLASMKKDLLTMRFNHATGQLSNPLQINLLKKDIARVQTIIRERELGINHVKKA